MQKTIFTFIFSLLMLINNIIYAGENSKILAFILDKPVTSSDVDIRIKLIERMNQIEVPEHELPYIKLQILDQIINEIILIAEAEKYNITIDDVEIDKTIRDIEVRSNLPESHIFNMLAEKDIYKQTYRKQIRAELASGKLISGYIAPRVKISKNEIYTEAMKIYPSKINLRYKEITSKSNLEDKNIANLTCNNLDTYFRAEDYSISEVNNSFNNISLKLASKLITANENEIIKVAGYKNKFFILCNKSINIPYNLKADIETNLKSKAITISSKSYIQELRKIYHVRLNTANI